MRQPYFSLIAFKFCNIINSQNDNVKVTYTNKPFHFQGKGWDGFGELNLSSLPIRKG